MNILPRTISWLAFSVFTLVASEKENIAVFELQNHGGLNTGEVGMITDKINSEFVATKMFNVVERDQIGSILKEQGFQASGACNAQDCLVELGQLLAVRKVVGGSIGHMGEMFVLTLKLIDVETGRIEAQQVSEIKTDKAKLLSRYVPQTVFELVLKAGYMPDGKTAKPKTKLVRSPLFWIPAASVLAVGGIVGGVVAVSGRDVSDGTSNELDLPPYPSRPVSEY